MENVEKYEKNIMMTIVIGVLILIILSLLVVFSIDFKTKSALTYNDSGSLDYNVYLKPNDFYESKSLPKGKKYISALIDYIDASFHYQFFVERSIDLNYDYYIDGLLQINDSDGKSIYEKKYMLLERKNVKETGQIFKVDQMLKIDYNKYNTLAKSFLSQYNVSSDAKFIARLHVNVVGTPENFENNLSNNGVIELSIPLKTNLDTIEFNENLSNKNDMLLQYTSTKVRSMPLLIVAIVLMIADIVFTVYKLLSIINSRDASTLYSLKLNKIKKDYERYISETVITQKLDDLLRTRSLRIILIKSFEDLLDIRDNLKSPILFHEEIPGVETVFYIITDNVAYLYVMHINKFKNNRKLLKGKAPEEEIEILIQ